MKQKLDSRNAIESLVRYFYSKVRNDRLLGVVFESVIQGEEEWEEHFQTLTNFWESSLLLESSYHGNPIAVHQQVDAHMHHALGQEHFDRWLELWRETLAESYEGELAQLAANRAGNIAQLMLIKMQQARS